MTFLPGGPSRVLLVNSLASAARSLLPDDRKERIAVGIAVSSAVGFEAFLGWGTSSLLSVTRDGLRQLPEVRPDYLLLHLLRGLYAGATFLLLLGTLTTSVSLLFLSDELPALLPLPIPHRTLFRRLLGRSIAAASAPTWFLALPLVAVASYRSPSPFVAAAALSLALHAVVLSAGGVGAAAALLLVRVVPPRRAKLLAATLSAVGLAAALVGIRGARPERLFDPVLALDLLHRLGTAPPPSPVSPVGWAALASSEAIAGSASGLALAAALAAAAFLFVALLSVVLAPLHLATWRRGRETEGTSRRAPAARQAVETLRRELLRAEFRSFLRDASTPAQVGSLAAVFVLDLLNLRLLPASDAAARDLLAGLQTSLALFLVSALSLRFAFPSLSGDGRAALLLRSYPLSPARHLAARYAARGLPSALATLVLLAVSAAVLRPEPAVLAASFCTGLVGAVAIPALHLGLGALAPRYGAPNAVAAALGPGGLFAMAASTLVSLAAAPVVSGELRLLAGALSGLRLEEGPLLAAWCAVTLAAAAAPLAFAVRSLERRDVAVP